MLRPSYRLPPGLARHFSAPPLVTHTSVTVLRPQTVGTSRLRGPVDDTRVIHPEQRLAQLCVLRPGSGTQFSIPEIMSPLFAYEWSCTCRCDRRRKTLVLQRRIYDGTLAACPFPSQMYVVQMSQQYLRHEAFPKQHVKPSL